MTEIRKIRADAVRNRDRILAAAREIVTLHGAEAAMDDIAALAGVAVGTLYRHFPTKTDLIAAVVAEYIAQIADDAEATRAHVEAGASAADEIAGFFRRVIEASATNHAVKAAADALGAYQSGSDDELRAQEALEEIISRAQADGGLRWDISVGDFYLLVSAAPTGQHEAARKRWISLVLPALFASSQ